MNTRLLSAAAAATLWVAATAQAATVTPLNRDPAGIGLNDPTPAAPVGNNPGTTVGDQRKIAYQFAADLWGAVLQSDVEIRIAASFQPLSCTANSGVLGSAGPWWVNRDFTNAPVAGIWYHSALANSLAGVNLNEGSDYVPPDDIDISSRFNANLGSPGCLAASGWYYGLDGVTPAGRINFLNVVMHEIGHGLGFSGFVNKTTGALANFDGIPRSDAYTQIAFDNVQALRFADPAMTNALRATAMKTPGRTVWDGAKVKADAALILDDKILLRTSGTLTANYEFGTAVFGPPATAANFTGSLTLANDGTGADTADACEPLPAGSLTGAIAFINRGTCGFELKVVNAQNAGAIGAVIGNVATSAPGLVTMADDPTVTATIPAVQIVVADADAIKAALPGVNITLGTDPGRLAGADIAGRVQLYSPTVVASGSTFSHYDTAVSPNALMEPFITSTLNAQYNIDLTPALYKDMGWGLNSRNARISRCRTTVPLLQDGGIILGANVVARSNVCEAGASKPGQYLKCMFQYTQSLRQSNLLTPQQAVSVNVCAIQRTIELILGH